MFVLGLYNAFLCVFICRFKLPNIEGTVKLHKNCCHVVLFFNLLGSGCLGHGSDTLLLCLWSGKCVLWQQ